MTSPRKRDKFDYAMTGIFICAIIVSFNHTIELYASAGFNVPVEILNAIMSKWFGIGNFFTLALFATIAAEAAFSVGLWGLYEAYREEQAFPTIAKYKFTWLMLFGGLVIIGWSNIGGTLGYNYLFGNPVKGYVLGLSIPYFVLNAILVNFSRIYNEENASKKDTTPAWKKLIQTAKEIKTEVGTLTTKAPKIDPEIITNTVQNKSKNVLAIEPESSSQELNQKPIETETKMETGNLLLSTDFSEKLNSESNSESDENQILNEEETEIEYGPLRLVTSEPKTIASKVQKIIEIEPESNSEPIDIEFNTEPKNEPETEPKTNLKSNQHVASVSPVIDAKTSPEKVAEIISDRIPSKSQERKRKIQKAAKTAYRIYQRKGDYPTWSILADKSDCSQNVAKSVLKELRAVNMT